jgi:hypothetical protein
VGEFFGTTGMTAIAGKFHRIPGIFAILTAIFAVLPCSAIASWMGTFLIVCHILAP